MVTHIENGVFRAVSDPTRRAILDQLSDCGLCVAEIAEAFEVSRPAVSKHLRVLKAAGLVTVQRDGRERVYSLDPRPLQAVDDWLSRYRIELRGTLRRLKEYVEGQP